MHELPSRLRDRLTRLADQLEVPAPRLLDTAGDRRTTFRIARDASAVLADLRAAGLSPAPVPGLPGCHAVPRADRDALTHAAAAGDGRLYIQGAASVRAAMAVGARPGEHVLDLAAAPGGKTLLLAEALQGDGDLVAVEAVRSRFHRLRANLERAGHADFVQTVLGDGRRLPGAFAGRFDRVLLDAPCSSEARIDPADPATFARWSLGKIRDMARKQWGLLGAAIRYARPGGEILYCTCSFAPEENEATVAAWLGAAGAPVEALPVELGDGVDTAPGLTGWGRKHWPEECAWARRILPDTLHEGLFVARLRRIA